MAVEDYLFTVDGSEGWQEIPFTRRLIPISSRLTDFAAQGNGTTKEWTFDGNYGIDSPYNTGVQISAGDRVTITAIGTWSAEEGYTNRGGVDGRSYLTPGVPEFTPYAVIGRIGTSSWFYIGGGVTFPATASGTLYWAVNAPTAPDFYHSYFWTQVIVDHDSLIVPEAENKAVIINDGHVYAVGGARKIFQVFGSGIQGLLSTLSVKDLSPYFLPTRVTRLPMKARLIHPLFIRLIVRKNDWASACELARNV